MVSITAGAAGMYCGSCLRDNALATELQALGDWEVTLLPLYTPIRTDEPDVSVDQVFFGGINVYLQQKVPLFRHLPRFLDRWLDNPRLIRRVASRAMSVNAKDLGEMTLSMVRGEHGFQAKEVRRLIDFLRKQKPDLICLTNLLVGGCIPALKKELPDVPVLVTLQGDDLFLDELEEPWRSSVLEEMKNLASAADGFITFSGFYRDVVADLFEIPYEKFHLTALGADLEGFTGDRDSGGNTIGYFARICPEKGFDLLVSAFLELAKRDEFADTKLQFGGWLAEKNREFFENEMGRIEKAGLSDRVLHVGSPDRDGKLEFFRATDVFCVPARFVEPKGMYAIEAMAAGIPVVAPDHGAFPEMIAASGGGCLFPAGDVEALAGCLAETLKNPGDLGRNGRAWAISKADRATMARSTAAVFEKFV
ncbi:MAG: glycosyltransferase family 4 protein [Verrucomicrobiales bacterium]|nr:glycosyltransferase family 4 protein [Verrucomicrobiales bacterium]